MRNRRSPSPARRRLTASLGRTTPRELPILRTLSSSTGPLLCYNNCSNFWCGLQPGGALVCDRGRNAEPPDCAGVVGEADVASGFFEDAFGAVWKLDGGDDAER